MPRLDLTLLGGFQAWLAPGSVLSLPTRKASALLAYLALPLGRAHPRDHLAALLWGGVRDASARKSLRQTVFVLRKALRTAGADVLRIEGEVIALDPAGVHVDAAAFEHAVTEGTPEALEQAVAAYHGDLLAGLTVGEPPFEEWLLAERERLRELSLEGHAKLLALQQTAGVPEVAVRTGLRLLAIDPLLEPVQRTVMRLYSGLGRRAAALRQYQQCVTVLHRELGIEPEAETKNLYQEILRQRATPAPRSASSRAVWPSPTTGPRRIASTDDAPLIGRVAEMADLQQALDQARAGRGSVVALVGEAGVGKTRLIAELAADVEHRGERVVIGRCYESEQILPFGPWLDALRASHVLADLGGMAPAWRAELARLLPELAESSAPPAPGGIDYRQLLESVVQAIRHLARGHPLLVILEDVHWADEMSLRLLAFLGRRIAEWPVLAVVTAREEELPDAPALRRALDELAGERRRVELMLGPLSQPDTLELVRWLARSGTEGQTVAQLGEVAWATSEGNPFVVVESIRAHAQGAMSVHDPAVELPQRVREMVSGRLERLSERGRTVVAVAAVIGREFEFPLLERAAALGDREAAEAVEELVRRRVLQSVGERFDFTHDRVRAAVLAGLLPARRKLLHRQVGEALEAVYAGALEPHHVALGIHFRDGEVWDRAVTYLERAGARALAHAAHREAAMLFEQALAALEHLPESRARSERAVDMMVSHRNCLYPLGELERVLRIGRRAQTVAEQLGDQRRLARTLVGISYALGSLGDLAGATEAVEQAAAIADALGDAQLKATLNGSRPYYGMGDYERAIEFARLEIAAYRSDRINERAGGGLRPAVRGRVWLALSLAELGEFGEGVVAADEALAIAETDQHAHDVSWACTGAGRLRLVKGDLAQAITVLERGLPLCKHGGELVIYVSRIAASLGLAYALSGRLDAGLALLEEAVSAGESLRFTYAQSLAIASLAEGHVLAGRVEEAARRATQATELAREHGHRGWEAWSLRVRGAAALAGGRLDEAESSYRAAIARAEEGHMRPLMAHCRLGLGLAAARQGRTATAHSDVATALDLYRALDMPFWRGRAEREVAAVGLA